MTPEGKVKAALIRELNKVFGIKCYRFMPVQNGMGKRGLDFYLCIHGVFVAIETKAAGKKPTAIQLDCMEEINLAGGLAFVVTGTDMIPQTVAYIERLVWSIRGEENGPALRIPPKQSAPSPEAGTADKPVPKRA